MYRFLVDYTTIENAIFPYKNVLPWGYKMDLSQRTEFCH